jgi:hypothetical protein
MAGMTAFAGEKIVGDELNWRLKLKSLLSAHALTRWLEEEEY